MSATVRAVSPWWTTAPSSWPAGTQVGDVAVMVVLQGSRSQGNYRSFPGWARQGSWELMVYRVTGASAPTYCDVFTRTVTDLDAPPARDVDGGSAVLVVLTGTAGAGRVRVGMGEVPARAGGGALVVYYVASDAQVMSGVTDLAGVGSTTTPSWMGSRTIRARVGWDAAPSDGVHGGQAPERPALALEILPPAGPASPSLLSPEAGNDVAAGEPVEFEWRHRASIPGGFQDAYQLRVDPGDGWKFWSASTGALAGAETTNLSSVQAAVVPWSQFIAEAEAQWQVRTREGADGQWSPWSEARPFTGVTPPSVSVTAPAGSVVGDLTPTVSWSRTTPRGSQTAYRVQVVDDAQVIYDSGVVPGDGLSHTVPALRWVNGGGVQARVRVQQTGGSWSAWGTSDFTVSWTAPTTPTVTAVALSRGVEVTLAGVAAGQRVELQRITREGLWEVVSRFDAATSDPVVVDFFAPWGRPTAYRAMSSDVLDGQPLTSDWGQSDPVTSMDRRNYLALAASPLTSAIEVNWSEDSEHTHQQDVAVGYGMGDRRPRTAYGIERGRSGSWTFTTYSHAETEALLDLLSEAEPVLLRVGAERAAHGGEADGGVHLVKRAGAVSEARFFQGPTQVRTISFPWVEADPVDPDEVIGIGLNRDGTLTIATDLEVGPGGTITITV